MRIKVHIYLIVISGLLFTQCLRHRYEEFQIENKANELTSFDIPEEFDFSTSKEVEINLRAPAFLSEAVFEVYYTSSDSKDYHIATGTFNNNNYKGLVSIPMYVDSLQIRSKYFGLEKLVVLPIKNNNTEYDYGVHYINNDESSTNFELGLKSATVGNFSYMGSYTANGYPSYLYQVNDHAWESLLSNLNQTLPEGNSVPDNNPDFLTSRNSLKLEESTNVYVTFAGEGSSKKSALGYFVYDGSKPVDGEHIIIFPNASAPGSGGSLHSGDKVLLGEFPAGTNIGWFLVPDGWSKSDGMVNDVNGVYYSVSSYNPESSSSLRQHMVFLKDIQNEVIVLGFEDSFRESSTSDHDFNDVVFYITLDRLEAADLSNVSSTTSPVDTDGDGIIDSQDAYPVDPTLAFNNNTVSGSTGSIAFEDLWPALGDFDFNDLVVGYRFNPITDANNLVKILEVQIDVRHIGASYHSGFAFEFPFSASKVDSVSGSIMSKNYVNVASNGTEAGSSKAVVFVFDDGWNVLGQTLNLQITFVDPLSMSEVGTFPFNPFLVVDGNRGKEIHLPDMPPTSLASSSYFGRQADYSNPSAGRYYRTNQNLPWAVNISGSYAIPVEKAAIYKGYLKFIDWANSAGSDFPDWYVNKGGYRDNKYLY